MNKELIILLVMFLLVLSFAFAETELLSHYLADETSGTDLANTVGTDGTVSNAAIWDADGKIGGCLDHADTYYATSNNTMGTPTNYTYCAWFLSTDYTSYGTFYSTTTNAIHYIYSSSGPGQDDEIYVRYATGNIFQTAAKDENIWYHLCVVNNKTGVSIYLNGSFVEYDGDEGETMIDETIFIGQHQSGSDIFIGKQDDIRFYNGSISPAEITWMYNDGEGTQDDYEAPSAESFTVTATDLYDSSSLSNYTVYITNSTDSFSNSTTSGTLIFTNATVGIYNITVSSNQSGGYFNVSFVDFDVSSDLAAELFQSVLILNATDLTDDSQLLDFAVTVPSQINHSNSSGQARLLLKAGEYNVIGNESSHLNVTKTISVAALETKFETLEFGNSHLHINATDIITGATLSTFNVFLEDLDTDFTGNISTTSGEVTFSLETGNFTITVSATDYVNLVENVTVDTIHTNHTSQLQRRNSILINIFAEGNQTVLNWTNVTASFDSDTSVFSSKSANGTIYLEDVTPEDYTITFSASGFDSRGYFINLISGSNVNLDVYLIGSEESTEITFTIVDASTSINLEDVLVSVAKKINLSFVTIAQKESDISGVVIFDLDQSIIYRFTLSKTEFETRTFDLTPTSTTYTIELTPESVIDYTTIYDRIDFTTLPLNTTLRTGRIIDFSIIAASLDGTVIDHFGVNSTFNGTNFIENISTSAAGGTATIQLNFDSFIGSIGVTYFIDIDGFDPVRINRNFYVSNVTAGNASISEVIDLFDKELGTSKQGMLLKALIAVAFIIIIMATIASMGVRDRRLNVVAACGLGFFMIFGWVPAGITIAIMVILLGSFFIGGIKGGTD